MTDPAREPPGLDAARRLLQAAAIAVVLGAAVVALGPMLVTAPATDLQRGLGRRHPTLVPAGRPERAPAPHPAIRAAPAAGLEALVPEPQDVLRP